MEHEALDRDAQLARAGEHGALGTLGGALEVSVLGDVHGVLAAELEGCTDKALTGVACDLTPDVRRARVHDVVRTLEDRAADGGAVAQSDLEEPLGQTGLVDELDDLEAGERRLLVRTKDDGVAGSEGGQGVGDRHRQRVVPRRDDADDALGAVARAGLRQHRHGARTLALGEIARCLLRVVAAHTGGVENLLEGLDAGLARVELDEVEHLALVLEHEVVQALQELHALLDGRGGPRGLSRTRRLVRALDVGDARLGQRRDNLTGERRRALTLGRVGGSSDAVAHALRHVLRSADGGRRGGLRSHGSTLGRATDNVLTLK